MSPCASFFVLLPLDNRPIHSQMDMYNPVSQDNELIK